MIHELKLRYTTNNYYQLQYTTNSYYRPYQFLTDDESRGFLSVRYSLVCMAATTDIDTDMRIGLAMLFGAIGFIAAFTMIITSINKQQVLTGWGFAVAMVASAILIAVIHLYG
jgi:hypothetical protein